LPLGRFNEEVLEERARNLGSRNGLKRLFITLPAGPQPGHAMARVEFHNANGLAQIVSDVAADVRPPAEVFPIAGGLRLIAGADPGLVQVTDVSLGPEPESLLLRIEPVGDYSTYSLSWLDDLADPLLARLDFKFRPGCFNLNCAPDKGKVPAPPIHPVLDYLARDYDSFRHLLVQAMRERVPGWEPTSEADLDQVILDLIAAEGDLLSDLQDRILNEAYLATSRKRVSLARHARLVDYHIHQGNQATTWLAATVLADAALPAGFGAWTGRKFSDPGSVAFATSAPFDALTALNAIRPYTWGQALDALQAGSTEADLALPPPFNPSLEASADAFRDLFRTGQAPHLLIEEKLNPATGTLNGRDPSARRLVRLLEGSLAADSLFDPAAGPTGTWLVRVRWRPEDALDRCFCLIARPEGSAPVEDISAFHGNLVQATQGRPRRTVFRPPGADLAVPDYDSFLQVDEGHWEAAPEGPFCALPDGPLAYRDTAPGGETPPRSSLAVTVSGFLDPWEERIDLIESDDDAPHFGVETDELGASRIRFGNNANGVALPEDAVVTCDYQLGQGVAGNVGADTLTGFDAAAFPAIENLWNPFDVNGGREPEPAGEVRRRAPEAYRARQLRAVTLEDYAARAEELPGVSAAHAAYAWTGSWRTVRVTLDPAGTTVLGEELRNQVADHLEAVRLIGEDLEIRPAHYVPLDIRLRLCAGPAYWPEHLRLDLESEFSEGYTSDGRKGFFHPDLWTFGQPLHASQILGRALSVPGVDRVIRLSMRRWDPGSGGGLAVVVLTEADLPSATGQVIEAEPEEILRVANDPSRLETGRIAFEIVGGRR
jgi:hypothetical protein